MQEIILFILTFIIVLMIYEMFVVSKTKKLKAANKSNFKNPAEISYLIKKYKLDMKKIDYNQLLQIVAIISSFDIAIVISLILLIKSFILEIIVGIVSMVVIILFSYHLIYLFYKKKGMIIND